MPEGPETPSVAVSFFFFVIGQESARPSIFSFYEKEEEKIIAKSLVFF
jgi:hypothetical protein